MSFDSSPDFSAIPLFDMQQFVSHDLAVRDQFVTRLRDVCHHVGFFYIKNHGISSQLLGKILVLTAAFFNLSQEEKDAIRISLSPHYRGYGRLGAETTEGKADYKESYDLGLEQRARPVSAEQPYRILQGPNQWPASTLLAKLHWQETVLEYIAAMQVLGQQLMRAISLTLGFSADYFVNQFCANAEDSYAILRLLRYPPGRVNGKHQAPELGVGPHVDFGCLVMLLQDQVGGLQVQNCSGQWIDAPPIKDTLVINIGHMLQIWSNNYFLATPHRVINVSEKIRHSVPFFFEPNLSTVVSPLNIPSPLLMQMNRPHVDPQTQVVYGKHMLKIYHRSFQ